MALLCALKDTVTMQCMAMPPHAKFEVSKRYTALPIHIIGCCQPAMQQHDSLELHRCSLLNVICHHMPRAVHDEPLPYITLTRLSAAMLIGALHTGCVSMFTPV